jgi:predicted phage terminase large subunit-like protein
MTYKGTPGSDYVVGLYAGRRGSDIYLIARRKGQWDFTQTLHQVRAMTQEYPRVDAIYVEEAANGPAIISALHSELYMVTGIKPEGGKEARAHAVAPVIEAGHVYLPNPRPHGRLVKDREWAEDFLEQCCAFPGGTHDDDVDALTQLIVQLRQRRDGEGFMEYLRERFGPRPLSEGVSATEDDESPDFDPHWRSQL